MDRKNGKGFKAARTRNEASNTSPSQKRSVHVHYLIPRPSAKEKICAIRDDDGPSFYVTGQTAKALRALVLAGTGGVTALEVAGWAYRFAAYCHCLRKLGLEIETIREAHEGGWHGRHVLHTLVRLERC